MFSIHVSSFYQHPKFFTCTKGQVKVVSRSKVRVFHLVTQLVRCADTTDLAEFLLRLWREEQRVEELRLGLCLGSRVVWCEG